MGAFFVSEPAVGYQPLAQCYQADQKNRLDTLNKVQLKDQLLKGCLFGLVFLPTKGGATMAKVLVLHYTEGARMPKFTPEQAAAFKEALMGSLAAHPDVKFEGIFGNPDGIAFGLVEAPNADVVKEVVDATGASYDIITEVAPLEL